MWYSGVKQCAEGQPTSYGKAAPKLYGAAHDDAAPGFMHYPRAVKKSIPEGKETLARHGQPRRAFHLGAAEVSAADDAINQIVMGDAPDISQIDIWYQE